MQKHHTARRKYTIVDGTLVPIVSGGADDGDADGDDEDDDEDGEGDGKPAPKMLSEERVQKIAAREYRRGQTKGLKDLLAELGLPEDRDELKRLVQKGQGIKVEESEELAAEREKLRKEREETNRERAEAAEDRFNARVERRLVKAGANPEKIEKIARLLELDPKDDPDTDDIDDAIVALTEEMPELFSTSSSDDDDDDGEDDRRTRRREGRVPNSDPGRAKKTRTPKGSGDERGRARLMERHPELANKT